MGFASTPVCVIVTFALQVIAIAPCTVTEPVAGDCSSGSTTPTSVKVSTPLAAAVKVQVPVTAGWPVTRTAEYCTVPVSDSRTSGVRLFTLAAANWKLVVPTTTWAFVGARFCC